MDVLELDIGVLELLLELNDAVIPLSDRFVFFLDGRENILLFHDYVHADSLLLVDVAVPDFDG